MQTKLHYSTKLWIGFSVSISLLVAAIYFAPLISSIPIIIGVYFFYSILKYYEK
jgi:hypothetical protein